MFTQSVTLLVTLLSALVAPQVTALSDPSSGGNTTEVMVNNNSNASNFSPMTMTSNKTASNKVQAVVVDHKNQSGIQARAASSYLASRAATGLQLKQRSSKPNGGAGGAAANAMGDPVGLDTALDSQMDLQTAAGEHKKYILVKKKPKHKKIKMEVYKPKMKYKKIKMKVPVKKMKKKKVKGYLVKKEKHHYH